MIKLLYYCDGLLHISIHHVLFEALTVCVCFLPNSAKIKFANVPISLISIKSNENYKQYRYCKELRVRSRFGVTWQSACCI